MIITIDGPTASGKSTTANLLAQKLNYFYLNSGYFYRTYAYLLLEKQVSLHNLETISFEEIKNLIDIDKIEYIYENGAGPHIFHATTDITAYLKNKNVDTASARVGKNIDIRLIIKEKQYAIISNYPNIVADGRDMATVIFPGAEYQFFLTASLKERALRWQKVQKFNGDELDYEQAYQLVETRDLMDFNRWISPLKVSLNSITIDNSNLTTEETINFILKLIIKK